MKIHEFQAKGLLCQYGVAVPESKVVTSAAEAYEAARRFGGTVVVKAQIHAGGRGKGGGVKVGRTPAEAELHAAALLGRKLITPQTGPEGRPVRRVLVEQGLEIEREFYFGAVIDRSAAMPVIMASREGGVEIEETARRSPDLIVKEWVDPALGLQPFQARRIAFELGLTGGQIAKAVRFISALYQAFVSADASLVEVNPAALTRGGEIVALDAKMTLDDNALYRHPEIVQMRDFEEEEPAEIQASRYGLNYIKLDGNVGCMVNGAGLAMATMDIIKLAGGSPANFLDVGGGASVEQVRGAFRILISDANVRAVLVNIFGGIMRCDVVAQGIVDAVKDADVRIPVVVRLEGTNVEQGREILARAGLDFELADGMADSARKVCDAVRRNENHRVGKGAA
jgi:succinyl-CoA synthetase beta subunit